MAETRRQVSIFINGKEVELTLNNVKRKMTELNAVINRNVIGSQEYNAAVAELSRLNGVLDEHRNRIRGIEEGWSLMKSGLGQIVGIAAGAFAADALIGYGKELFHTATQMQLLENKAKTVFGTSLPAISVEAKKNAADMGLTTAQYIAQAAAIQDLLVPMGFQRDTAAGISAQLVNLSGALSEWSGGQRSAEEVSHILQAALTGEREALKSLGIAISDDDVKARLAAEGHAKLTGKALEQAKATATLNLILEKSTDAQAAYAQGSDTMARRQERLIAKIAEISQKIAQLLIPVFEALAAAAGFVVDIFGGLVDEIDNSIQPAKSASKAFDEQAQKVASLEKGIAPLIDRYDLLKGKTNLSKIEQSELRTIIDKVAAAIPTAIQGFDEYGKALGLNTTAARAFIETEKARLEFVNKEAIEKNQKAYDELEQQANQYQAKLNAGRQTTIHAEGMGAAFGDRAMTGSEIAEIQKELEKVQLSAKGARAEVARLKGEAIDVPKEASTGGNTGSGGDPKEAEKKAKELADHIEKLKEQLRQISAENDEAAYHDEETRAIKKLQDKYAHEIEEATKGEFGKSAAVKAIVEKLEAEQGENIARVKASFKAKELADSEKFFEAMAILRKKEAEQEAKDAEESAKFLAEREKGRLEAERDVREFLGMDEREKQLIALDEQYTKLLKMADDYGLSSVELLAAYTKKKEEINAAANAKQLKNAEELVKAEIDLQLAKSEAVQQGASALAGLFEQNSAMGQAFFLVEKIAAAAHLIISFQKERASIFAANAALGVAGVPLSIAQTSAARIRMLTGLGVIAATTVQKFVPQKTKQKVRGGYHEVTGADDGIRYNAQLIGPPQTGLLPGNGPVLFPSAAGGPVLANERGREFFVSYADLQKPIVAALVGRIHAITKNGGAVAQFAEGGAVGFQPAAAASPTSALDSQLMMAMLATMQELTAALKKGIIAVVPDTTVLDIENRRDKINAASGGFFK